MYTTITLLLKWRGFWAHSRYPSKVDKVKMAQVCCTVRGFQSLCVRACSAYPFLLASLVDNALHGMIEKPGLAVEHDGETWATYRTRMFSHKQQ